MTSNYKNKFKLYKFNGQKNCAIDNKDILRGINLNKKLKGKVPT